MQSQPTPPVSFRNGFTADATTATTTAPQSHRKVLFEDARMATPRLRKFLWRALYDIWRLSWYCTHTKTLHVDRPSLYPRFISLKDWLVAVRDPYDQTQHDDEREVKVSAEELLSIAGAWITSRMVTTRWSRQTDTLRYAITPWAGSCIQLFLNQDLPQQMRTGVPGAGEQMTICSLSANRALGGWLHVSPQVRIYHAQWVAHIIDNTLTQARGNEPPAATLFDESTTSRSGSYEPTDTDLFSI